MAKKVTHLHRRRFLKTALSAGAAVMAPEIIPSSALGRDGASPPASGLCWAESASATGDLRPWLLPGTKGRPIRGGMRHQSGAPRRGQENRR